MLVRAGFEHHRRGLAHACVDEDEIVLRPTDGGHRPELEVRVRTREHQLRREPELVAVEDAPHLVEVDALRALMLTSGVSAFGLGADFIVLLAAVAIMVVTGGKLYPRVAT